MSTAQIFLPQQGALSDLADWIAGDLGSGYARLYTNNHVYDPADRCFNYTEASWVGYSPVNPLNWSTPFINSDGKAETDSTVCTWSYTGSTGTQTAFGIYLTDASLTKLLLVIPFLSPVTLSPTVPNFSQVIQFTETSEL